MLVKRRCGGGKVGGYTLLELTLVAALISLLSLHGYPWLSRQLETQAMRDTVAGLRLLERFLHTYHQKNQRRWPGDLNTLARDLPEGASFRNRNGVGLPYQLRDADEDGIALVTNMRSQAQARQVARLLGPLARESGRQVHLTLVPDAKEGDAGKNLARRDGPVHLDSPLNMNGNALKNVRGANGTRKDHYVFFDRSRGFNVLIVDVLYANHIVARGVTFSVDPRLRNSRRTLPNYLRYDISPLGSWR